MTMDNIKDNINHRITIMPIVVQKLNTSMCLSFKMRNSEINIMYFYIL